MTAPSLTIGMPVYNGQRFLRQALDTLLAQTYRDFELLISDNASTDSTPAICAEYAARDSRIRYVRQSENAGVFDNVTFVLENARGRYFMLVGDDDVYDPAYAAKMIELLEKDPEVDGAYSNFTYVDPNGVTSPSWLKHFLPASNDRVRNILRFLRVRIVLPMMMGVFRTAALRRALPFVTFPDGMTGGIDIVFMLRFLTYSRVASTDEVLFQYRLKDRTESNPAKFRRSRWSLRWFHLRHNWVILIRHILPILWGSRFSLLHKVWLSAYAMLLFFVDWTLIRALEFVRARRRTHA
jgi:glycosyltransferase involved in cell wall biosynthesis